MFGTVEETLQTHRWAKRGLGLNRVLKKVGRSERRRTPAAKAAVRNQALTARLKPCP